MRSWVVLLLIVFSCRAVLADPPQLAEKQRGRNFFVVGVGDYDYLPHTGFKRGEFVGFGAALLQAFAQNKGYQFEYRILSLPRMFKEFLDDQTVDFMYPNNEYWGAGIQQKKNVIFSTPVTTYVDGLVVLEENRGLTLDKLKTMVVMKGFDAPQYADLVKKGQLTIYEHSDIQSMLRMVMNKRVQAAYVNPVIAAYQMKTELKQQAPLTFAEKMPYTESSYYFSTIKYRNVIDEFNEFLVKEKPLINKLRARYGVDVPILKDFKNYRAPKI